MAQLRPHSAQLRRVKDLAGAAAAGAEANPRHGAMLVSAYAAHARLGSRDEDALRAVGALLQAACGQGRPVPPEFLLPLASALARHLRLALDGVVGGNKPNLATFAQPWATSARLGRVMA